MISFSLDQILLSGIVDREKDDVFNFYVTVSEALREPLTRFSYDAEVKVAYLLIDDHSVRYAGLGGLLAEIFMCSRLTALFFYYGELTVLLENRVVYVVDVGYTGDPELAQKLLDAYADPRDLFCVESAV